MRTILSLVAVVGLNLTLVCNAHAELQIHTDANFSWTHDPDTGLDWLDFDGGPAPSTEGRSVTDILAQLGPGGDYEGWRYATRAEVTTFIFNVTGVAHDVDGSSENYDGITDAVANYTGYTVMERLSAVVTSINFDNVIFAITADPAPGSASKRFKVELGDVKPEVTPGVDFYGTSAEYNPLGLIEGDGTGSSPPHQ